MTSETNTDDTSPVTVALSEIGDAVKEAVTVYLISSLYKQTLLLSYVARYHDV